MVRPKAKKPKRSKTIRISESLANLDLTRHIHTLESFFPQISEVASLERAGKLSLAKELKYKLTEEIGMEVYRNLREAVEDDEWSGCMVCGAVPLIDFTCRKCGSYILADADEGTYSYDEDSGELCLIGFSGDYDRPAQCDCGCGVFDAEKHALCGYHEYQAEKDKRRGD